MIEFLWELGQQRTIADVGSEAAAAQQDATQAIRDADELERRVDALTLTCQALWELSRTRLGLTEAELLAKIREVDVRDGKADGKVATPSGVCPKCKQRTSVARRQRVYCGTQLLGGAVFRNTHRAP